MCIHFKIDIINSLLTTLARNCFMDKIDIKGPCYSVSIQKEHQSFLNYCLQFSLSFPV